MTMLNNPIQVPMTVSSDAETVQMSVGSDAETVPLDVECNFIEQELIIWRV